MNKRILENIIWFTLIFLFIIILTGCTDVSDKIEVLNKPIIEETVNKANELESLTMEEKLKDFEYLYNLFKENYPFFEVNKRLNGIDWLGNKEMYIEKIKNTTTDKEFIEAIEEILDDLNNGHVHLIDKEYFAYTYVSSTLPENNLLPWAEALENEVVFNRYDFDRSEIENIKNEIYDMISNSNSETNTVQAFKTSIIIPDEVAYIHINSMDGSRVEKDGIEIRKFYEEVRDYDKLIIDIRGNSGGSDNYWIENIIEPLANKPITIEYYGFARGDYGEPFFQAKGLDFKPITDLNKDILNKVPSDIRENFDKYYLFVHTIKPKDPVGFNGKIYLIVDSAVYSSSESFAAFCKDSGFATIIGETTGGDGRGINPVFFSLPYSGLAGRFSAVLCLNGDYTINEEVKTIPDIYVNAYGPMPLYNFSHDQAVQYVIKDKTH